MLNRLSSIKTKLIFVYILVIVAVLIATGYYLQNSLRDYFLGFMEERTVRELKLVEAELKPLLSEGRQDELVASVNRMGQNLKRRITIIALDGTALADSHEDYQKMENHLKRPEIQDALTDGYGLNKRYSPTLGVVMRYVAFPMVVDGQRIGVIRAAIGLEQLTQLYQGIWEVLFKTGLVAILVAILISLQAITKVTKPIEEITALAQDIAQGDLEAKISIKSRDEIGTLARVFNHMTVKIKEKLTELATEKNKIEAIISSISDGVIAVNPEGKIILFNPGAEQIFAIASNRVKGKSLIEITKNYKLVDLIETVLAKEESITEEIKLLLPTERTFRVQVGAIKNQKSLVGAVLVLRDITDIRKLEGMRRDFVSNVTHELKTPLTSIKGYVETILESKPEQKTLEHFLRIINQETNRLERLIVDLLDLAKIESESSYFNMEETNLADVINNTVAILNKKAEDKNITLRLRDLDGCLIKGDNDQLTRLMINLLDNAIKYTPAGGQVEIKTKIEATKVELRVIDTGIGIPEADLERIFERFYRVDKARSRKEGGTGLGLSIVKHIIKQHNGQIDVISEQGVGTEFIIRLPLKE